MREIGVVEKPWGQEIIFACTLQYAGKILQIRRGERLSLQYHKHKHETMYIYDGLIRLTKAGIEMIAGKGSQPIEITPGTEHRIEALDDTVIFEVSTPELDDIVRLEDDYGRASG